jgi:hypothetical protein
VLTTSGGSATQREGARDLLRGLLNEANSEVLVVDPYFTAHELAGFTLAVGRYDIPIRILSSAEALKEAGAKDSKIEKGDQLLAVLEQLQGHEHMNPFEIRVMPGERPTVHDRFLVIDKRIWLLRQSRRRAGRNAGHGDRLAQLGRFVRRWLAVLRRDRR